MPLNNVAKYTLRARMYEIILIDYYQKMRGKGKRGVRNRLEKGE
jgi:hypothetical protein